MVYARRERISKCEFSSCDFCQTINSFNNTHIGAGGCLVVCSQQRTKAVPLRCLWGVWVSVGVCVWCLCVLRLYLVDLFCQVVARSQEDPCLTETLRACRFFLKCLLQEAALFDKIQKIKKTMKIGPLVTQRTRRHSRTKIRPYFVSAQRSFGI